MDQTEKLYVPRIKKLIEKHQLLSKVLGRKFGRLDQKVVDDIPDNSSSGGSEAEKDPNKESESRVLHLEEEAEVEKKEVKNEGFKNKRIFELETATLKVMKEQTGVGFRGM